MSKYYFDVKQTVVNTIAIEADSPEQAKKRVATALKTGEFVVTDGKWDDIELVEVQEEVEKCIASGFCHPDEIATFDCTHVVYDENNDYFACPVCGNCVADDYFVMDTEDERPECCPHCNTKLSY